MDEYYFNKKFLLHYICIYDYFWNQLPIISKLVNSIPAHGEVYSMQLYVIKFVSDLSQVYDFLRLLRFPPSIKLSVTIKLKYRWYGVKRHNPNPSMDVFLMFFMILY